jgi:Zn-dependent protease/CBS domain-containing protein
MTRHRSTFRVGRLAGVPIGVQPLWLLVVALMTYMLGHDYFRTEDPGLDQGVAYLLGLVSVLTLFGGVLLHELGHAVVARRRGVEVEEIDLWLLGGVARLRGEPEHAEDELRFALAGPAVTAVLLAVAGGLRAALGGVLPEWGRALLDYQVYVNAMILAFNLLPAFPLDGGRVARALAWRRSGDREAATNRAAALGRAFGFGFVLLGVLAFAGGAPAGLWLALIGTFLVVAGAAEAQHVHVDEALTGILAGDLMSAPPVALRADGTLEDAIADGFGVHLFGGFPVVDDAGHVVGVITLEDVRMVPAGQRTWTATGAVATRDAELLTAAETPVTELLMRPAFGRVGRAVVVDEAGRPLGLISATDIQRCLRAHELRVPTTPNPKVGAA